MSHAHIWASMQTLSKLHFNVSKCKKMHMGSGNPNAPYFLNGTAVEEGSMTDFRLANFSSVSFEAKEINKT